VGFVVVRHSERPRVAGDDLAGSAKAVIETDE
jgi:hypothetical protein